MAGVEGAGAHRALVARGLDELRRARCGSACSTRSSIAAWRASGGSSRCRSSTSPTSRRRLHRPEAALRGGARPARARRCCTCRRLRPTGPTPVVLNVNGHEGTGIGNPYIQARCINLAKKGLYALNVEWIGQSQLANEGLVHYRMNQLDLVGTPGLAVFYESLRRSVDIALGLPHADASRIAVTGLSGGGWQTIMISALDTRVTLASPVAGHSSFVTRTQWPDKDLGDSEQTPSDLASVVDYPHLNALMAPRPLQLSHNAKDSCCFRADYALGPMVQQAHAGVPAARCRRPLRLPRQPRRGAQLRARQPRSALPLPASALLRGQPRLRPARDRRDEGAARGRAARDAAARGQRRLQVAGPTHRGRPAAAGHARAANGCGALVRYHGTTCVRSTRAPQPAPRSGSSTWITGRCLPSS